VRGISRRHPHPHVVIAKSRLLVRPCVEKQAALHVCNRKKVVWCQNQKKIDFKVESTSSMRNYRDTG
jgi:hypothetical protein